MRQAVADKIFPGGVLTVGFLEDWSNNTRRQDLNDICGLAGAEGPACDQVMQNVTGVKPVDVDVDGACFDELVIRIAPHLGEDLLARYGTLILTLEIDQHIHLALRESNGVARSSNAD